MRWRKHKRLQIRPWYEVDDEECDLARQLLNNQIVKADRERRALQAAWFGLLSRIHAVLQQERGLGDLLAAVEEEIDRLENDLNVLYGNSYVGDVEAWKTQLRTWADEYIANARPFQPLHPPGGKAA